MKEFIVYRGVVFNAKYGCLPHRLATILCQQCTNSMVILAYFEALYPLNLTIFAREKSRYSGMQSNYILITKPI